MAGTTHPTANFFSIPSKGAGPRKLPTHSHATSRARAGRVGCARSYSSEVSITARLNDKQFRGHRLRHIPHPLDEVVAEVIETYRSAAPPLREAILNEMTDIPARVLCGSAERLAAMAVRSHSAAPLRQALVAVGMAVAALDDPRDHLYPLAAVHHSAVILDTPLAAVINSVTNQLPTAALERLHAFDNREERDKSLQAFGLRTTGDGDEFRYR